jgi:hypothetical protein
VIADSCVSISLAAAVIPSCHEPFWIGLGAAALDLLAAGRAGERAAFGPICSGQRSHGCAAVMSLQSWSRVPSELLLRRSCRSVAHRTRCMCCCIMNALPPSPPRAPGDANKADTVESLRGATGDGRAQPTYRLAAARSSVQRRSVGWRRLSVAALCTDPASTPSVCAHATSRSRSTHSSLVSCASVGREMAVHRYSQAILVLMIDRSTLAFASISPEH